jgi:hypothetical protein
MRRGSAIVPAPRDLAFDDAQAPTGLAVAGTSGGDERQERGLRLGGRFGIRLGVICPIENRFFAVPACLRGGVLLFGRRPVSVFRGAEDRVEGLIYGRCGRCE